MPIYDLAARNIVIWNFVHVLQMTRSRSWDWLGVDVHWKLEVVPDPPLQLLHIHAHPLHLFSGLSHTGLQLVFLC